MHDFKFQAYLKYSYYIALLLYYLCLNTDVSIMLFFIKPEPYYNFSLVGMKKTYLMKEKTTTKTKNNPPKKPKQAPKKQQKCPRALKLNFQVSLLVFLARRKEEAEISSEICTAKQNDKIPSQLTLGKEQRCGEMKTSKLKQHLKYIIWSGDFCQD